MGSLLPLLLKLLLSGPRNQLPLVVIKRSPSLLLLMLPLMSTVLSLRAHPEDSECSTLLMLATLLLLLLQLPLRPLKLLISNLLVLLPNTTSKERQLRLVLSALASISLALPKVPLTLGCVKVLH